MYFVAVIMAWWLIYINVINYYKKSQLQKSNFLKIKKLK